MNRASVGPCTPSFGTTRKNVGYWPFVKLTRVAEPETKPMWARVKIGPAASTAKLASGPTTARIFLFETNCCATVDALLGSTWMSPSTRWILVWLRWLKSATASFEKFSSSSPIAARAPVNPPMTPIVAEQAAFFGCAPTAVSTDTPTATASAAAARAKPTRFIASSSGASACFEDVGKVRLPRAQSYRAEGRVQGSTAMVLRALGPGVFEQAQMPVHHFVDPLLVARAHRVDGFLVHRDGCLRSDRACGPRGTRDLELTRQRGHEGREHRVLRCTCELGVEAIVELRDPRPVVEGLALQRHDAFHLGKVRLGAVAPGELRNRRL